MDASWHVSYTCVQKLLCGSFERTVFIDTVEFHRTGTGRGPDSTLYCSAEN